MAPVRLPRLAFAASALWAAWWYARAGQGAGLLAFAAVFCAACLATRRSLKPTTRAVVWTAVALLSQLSVTNNGRTMEMPNFRPGMSWEEKRIKL